MAVPWRSDGREDLGNGQMMSRWPLRSGVGVDGGRLYFAAGMWPNEGVYLYALDSRRGTVIWKNGTSGSDYRAQPHPPSVAVTGVAPQGCVLAHDGQLFVPTGRNVPAAFDCRTGQLLYYHSRPRSWGDRWGGTWNMLAGGLLFGWRCHFEPDGDVRLGEFQPVNDDGLIAFDAKTGEIRRDFPGKLRAVVHNGTLYMSGSGRIDAYDFDSWARGAKLSECTKWSAPHDRAYAMILAGKTLVVGGQGTVTALSTDTGQVLWKDQVPGQARSLAVADGRLLVSTTTGQISCYGPKAVDEPRVISSEAQTPAGADDPDPAVGGLGTTNSRYDRQEGGLLPGVGSRRWPVAVQSGHAVGPEDLLPGAERRGGRVDTHPAGQGEAVRRAGCGASRIAGRRPLPRVLCRPDRPGGCLPGRSERPFGEGDLPIAPSLRRVRLRCRGSDEGGPDAIRQWLLDGGVPADEIITSEKTVQVVRGRLPGAGNWTHEYADAGKSGASADQRVRLPLKLLWFGEPGPARMIARHWKGPAPLSVNGRMFVVGQYSLMAADAYNGRPLWRRDLPQVGRFPANSTGSNVVADENSVYVATGKTCLRLDAATGQTIHTYELPTDGADVKDHGTKSPVWSYLSVGRHGILGSAGTLREADYLFLFGKDGELRWTYSADGTFGSHAVSMDDGRVYLIERTSPERIARAKRLGEHLPASCRLVALDAATGKVAWETDAGIAGRHRAMAGRRRAVGHWRRDERVRGFHGQAALQSTSRAAPLPGRRRGDDLR